MPGGKIIGVLVIAGCLVVGLRKLGDCLRFQSESLFTEGIIESQNHGPDAQVVVNYADQSGQRHTASLNISNKMSSQHRFAMGRSMPIYVHRTTNAVRKASFVAFWFEPIIYGIGVILGIIFLLPRKKDNPS